MSEAARAGENRHYILLPHPARRALLVDVRDGVPSLPFVGTEQFEAAVGNAAMRRMLATEIVYLRLVALVEDEASKAWSGLRALDSPSAAWLPPAGMDWLDFDIAEYRSLAPPALRDGFDAWLQEQRGGLIPPLRPDWARPGWFAQVTEWTRDVVAAAGLRLTGPIRQERQWAISSVLSVPTDEGTLYLKAVFSLFHHEPAVTAALARLHPGAVPEVLAVEPERGWLLMRELRGRQLWEATDVDRAHALALLARIQRQWVGRGGDIVALGGPRRTLDVLIDQLAELPRHPELSAVDDSLLGRLHEATPRFAAAARELSGLGIPDTIVHGDFHLGNVMADGERYVIFDWSDACLGHPFLDLETTISRSTIVTPSTFSAYLAEWMDLLPREWLLRAVELARPLSALHQVVSYVHIIERLEPEDRIAISTGPADWLSQALDLVEAFEPE